MVLYSLPRKLIQVIYFYCLSIFLSSRNAIISPLMSLNKHWHNGDLDRTQFSSVQSLSRVRLFATLWITARQASLSITNSRSSPRLTSIESVTPSSHLILCRPLLLLSPIPPSIRVFSNESTLRMRWPKYWSFSFSIIPSKEIPAWSEVQAMLRLVGRSFRYFFWNLRCYPALPTLSRYW